MTSPGRSGQGAGGSEPEAPAPRALPPAPSDRRTALGLFILTFVTYAWFFSGGGWNQNAHFDLTRALVERQTLSIDGYHGNTGDVSPSRASGEWRVYINKPPGVSFLGAIPYAFLYLVEGGAGDGWEVQQANAYLVTVLTCGVAGALIPVVLFVYGVRRVSRFAAVAVALAVGLGTIVFPYSTILMAHVPSALFLLLAFVWLDERPLLAGVCAGIAGTCYYLCIPAAGVMFVGLIVRKGGLKPALRFLAGGIPFGIALGLYHWACFGSPFVTSLEVSKGFTQTGLLFGVFRLPAPAALWGLTFSEYRGLFFVSPVLLLALLGARSMNRRELAMIAAIVALFLFAIAGFNAWHGGSAFGPRYLISIVPLLAIPMLYVRGRALAIAGIVLGVLSFGIQLLATSVDPMPRARVRRPVQDYLLRVGQTSVNPTSVDEVLPYRKYPRGSYESTWASFNLGELPFGAGNPLSVVPVALWALGGAGVILRRAS